jgi:hypothetical protein
MGRAHPRACSIGHSQIWVASQGDIGSVIARLYPIHKIFIQKTPHNGYFEEEPA